MRRLLLLLALIAATPAAAQDGWQNGGDGPPAPGSQAAQDGFGVMALTTDDSERFFREWNGPTPPTLPTTDRVTRGHPIRLMLIFCGCGAGADGNCNATADFVTLRPDGSTFEEAAGAEVWRGPATIGTNLYLSPSSWIAQIPPDAPTGNWILRARVTDHVRGITLQVERRVTIEAVPATPAAATPTT
jgi:hypothetical protein